MKFKHKVDLDKGIVIVKAESSVTFYEVIYEIQKAIVSKRGIGIPRRLIDVTDMIYEFNDKDIQKIFAKLKLSANILETKRVAFLVKEYPKGLDIKELSKEFSSDSFEIGVFIEKAEAVTFLNKRL